MIIISAEHFFEAAQTGYPGTGLQMGTVVEHETGNSTAKAEQNAVRKELNTEDAQSRTKRPRIYGEIAQPRSHLLKERLILEPDVDISSGRVARKKKPRNQGKQVLKV
jgi:hypothetical protein